MEKWERLIVDCEQTAISFFRRNFSSVPLSLIYKLFRSKKIKLNGDYLRYYQYRLKKEDVIEVKDYKFKKKLNTTDFKNQEVRVFIPQVKFEILYEDENVIIVIKDHDIEIHNDKNPENTLNNAVSYYLSKNKELNKKDVFFSASHRIDKLTKGIVVYPKNEISKRILHKCFGEKDIIEKKYLAICENRKMKKAPSLISGFICKDDNKKKMLFDWNNIFEKKETKSCSMLVEEIAKKRFFSVFEIKLITGRKHQIRSSLSYLDLPIIGDIKYGSSIVLKNKIKLFAYSIKFINLPEYLSYLNGKKIEIKGVKDKIILQINSSAEGNLPRKLLKY